MESGSHISYTKTLEEQTLVYLSISPPNLSMMLVWNDLIFKKVATEIEHILRLSKLKEYASH